MRIVERILSDAPYWVYPLRPWTRPRRCEGAKFSDHFEEQLGIARVRCLPVISGLWHFAS